MSGDERALADVSYEELSEMPALTLFRAVEGGRIDVSDYDLSGDEDYSRKKRLLDEKMSLGRSAHNEQSADFVYRLDNGGAEALTDGLRDGQQAAKQREADDREVINRRARKHAADVETTDLMRESDSTFDSPISLTSYIGTDPLPPTVLQMTNDRLVFLATAVNMVFGPSEAGKSMLMLLATIQEIKSGRPVIIFDYENGPRVTVERLLMYGATPEEVALIDYWDMTGRALPSPDKVEKMSADLVSRGGSLVWVDSVTAAMEGMGLLDVTGPMDIQTFYRVAGQPWAEGGCCLVVIDHCPKENPFTPYGGERKTSGCNGMILNVVIGELFDQATAGYSKVYIHKAREGKMPAYVREEHKGMPKPLRLFGEFHVQPPVEATPSASSVAGSLSLVPVDASTVSARSVYVETQKAAQAERAELMLRRTVVAWFVTHDGERRGRPKTWPYNGQRGKVAPGDSPVPKVVGPSTSDIRNAVEAMIADGSLVAAADGLALAPHVTDDVNDYVPEGFGAVAEEIAKATAAAPESLESE